MFSFERRPIRVYGLLENDDNKNVCFLKNKCLAQSKVPLYRAQACEYCPCRHCRHILLPPAPPLHMLPVAPVTSLYGVAYMMMPLEKSWTLPVIRVARAVARVNPSHHSQHLGHLLPPPPLPIITGRSGWLSLSGGRLRWLVPAWRHLHSGERPTSPLSKQLCGGVVPAAPHAVSFGRWLLRRWPREHVPRVSVQVYEVWCCKEEMARQFNRFKKAKQFVFKSKKKYP